jgi:aristolochene synthase
MSSTEEMVSYNDRLIQVAQGIVAPDSTVCAKRVLQESVQSMRSMDEVLANEVVEGFSILLQTQADQRRLRIEHLGPYLECRENDIGRPYVLVFRVFHLSIWSEFDTV